MGIEKAGTTLGKKFILKAGKAKRLFATNPSKVAGGLSVSKLQGDVIQITKKLVPADTALFSWAKKKPEFSMTKINPDSLALVHMTNYYPSNGKILSTNLATKTAEGAGCARTTIHFAINKPVSEHELGNAWDTMDYAIIVPFKETIQGMPKSKVIGGIQEDFFFQDMVPLPRGSVIVKYNPDISSGNFLVSDVFDGIKLIETSNRNLNESADVVIKKTGYTTFNDALRRFLGASGDEMKLLTSKNESERRGILEQMDNPGGIAKYIKSVEEVMANAEFFSSMPGVEETIKQCQKDIECLRVFEKYSKGLKAFPEAWKKFCSEENYINKLHSKTPWFKAEMSICGIEMAQKANGNSWGRNLKQILIRNLNEAEATLPKDKTLGYDVKKVVKILEESKTPKIAKERMQQELNLKPMPLKKDTREILETMDSNENGEELVEFILMNMGIE